MKNLFLVFLLILNTISNSFSQNPYYDAAKVATIVSWNVENLFDTIDAPDIIDEEFLPGSDLNWNTEKYLQKLKNLDYVLSSINKNELPELIALQEIENIEVLKDLIKQEGLSKAKYSILHKESPDLRGIDVALLYRSDAFVLVSSEMLRIQIELEPDFKTRDIMYVFGKLHGDEIHIFINHWSSRRGGEQESEPKRMASAILARKKIDEIQKIDKNAKIILLGDFNDTPFNASLKSELRAGNNLTPEKTGDLYNLMYDLAANGKGSHSFDGKWNMLDNVVVSYPLLFAKKGFSVNFSTIGLFFDEKTVFLNNKTGFWQPNRTYSGNRYYAGFSDHLPVFVQLKTKE